MDFWIQMAFSVLFEVLRRKQKSKEILPALRKLYLTLHAQRALFLKPEDTVTEALERGR
jgi:hypothetical protein